MSEHFELNMKLWNSGWLFCVMHFLASELVPIPLPFPQNSIFTHRSLILDPLTLILDTKSLFSSKGFYLIVTCSHFPPFNQVDLTIWWCLTWDLLFFVCSINVHFSFVLLQFLDGSWEPQISQTYWTAQKCSRNLPSVCYTILRQICHAGHNSC